MAAGVKNLVIEQKASFVKRLTYKDKAKRPINLTGFTARMTIEDGSGNVIVTLTTENGGIVLGGVNGTIDLYLSAAATSAMTFTKGNYDLKLINGTIEERLLMGTVTLSKGVTA